jgi:hypothetical protein
MIVVVVLAAGSDPDVDDPGVSWPKVAIGIGFLVLAANQWKKRPKDGQVPKTPVWMATIDTATPAKAAVLGTALSGADPKNLGLALAAAASIAEAGLDQADKAVAIAVFVALGSRGQAPRRRPRRPLTLKSRARSGGRDRAARTTLRDRRDHALVSLVDLRGVLAA